MKLIPEKEIEDVSKSDRWFESIGTPSSDYQLGFIIGSIWTQNRIEPLMIEFAEWCSDNYVKLFNCNWVIKTTGFDKTDYDNFTTKQLLEKFLKTKQK